MKDDELVLVKRVRPRTRGRFSVDGSWPLAVQALENKEAIGRWALKEDAPFKPVPPLKAEKWKAAPLHVLKSQLWQLIA